MVDDKFQNLLIDNFKTLSQDQKEGFKVIHERMDTLESEFTKADKEATKHRFKTRLLLVAIAATLKDEAKSVAQSIMGFFG